MYIILGKHSYNISDIILSSDISSAQGYMITAESVGILYTIIPHMSSIPPWYSI